MRTKAQDTEETANRQASQAEMDPVITAIFIAELDAGDEVPPLDGTTIEGLLEPDRAERLAALREAVVAATGVLAGESARRQIADMEARAAVVRVARRVASSVTKNMTDAEVLAKLNRESGFRRSIGGHLHEHFDAEDLARVDALRRKLGLKGGRLLELFPEHNRPGLDGEYLNRARGTARWAQHKLTLSQQQMKKAGLKAPAGARSETELVVGRGTRVNKETIEGLAGVREAGRSVKEIGSIVERAADPAKVTAGGAKAAQKITAKAGGIAAGFGVGFSVASDARGVIKGEKSVGEAAENAAWAGGEAATSAVVTASAAAAAAPTLAAATSVLAGSSLAGTTAMAAGVATLGPVGVVLITGAGISYGFKKVRSKTRGEQGE